MTSIRELCEQEGIAVRGACFTGKAADGLQNESGIESGTIHSFLNKLESGKFNETKPKPEFIKRDGIEIIKQNGIKQEWDFSKVDKAQRREIWIVDEAGLVDDNLMEQLQKGAEARGAQVVFSGDYQQLPPVGAGSPMKSLIESGAGTAFLEDIRRQKNIELLEAVRESVKGDHLKTFKKLDKSGDYRESGNKKERQAAIKNEMVTEKLENYKKNILLVSNNVDRKAFNKEIRTEYVKRGEIEEGCEFKITSREGERETTEKRYFAAGDRVIFTANDNKLGVKNGTLGTIEKIEENQFIVKIDTGETKQFFIDKYNDIDHSYAVTSYKAQGMTVEKVVADMSTKGKIQDRNALYVDISRAKTKAIVYTDDKQKLEKQTLEFAHKITSKDFSAKIQSMDRGNRIENNDRYHAPQPETTEKIIEKMKQEPQKLKQYRAQEQQKARETQEITQQKIKEEAEQVCKVSDKQKVKEPPKVTLAGVIIRN